MRLDLPREVMRRAALVAVAALVVALGLGLWRAEDDVEDELKAALSLAAALARLAELPALGDEAVVQALRAGEREVPLRHLSLTLRDEEGRLLLGRRSEPPAPAPLEALARWHARWRPAPELPPVQWTLPREQGRVWTLTLAPTPVSETREALAQLLMLLLVLSLGAVAMLLVMNWNIRRVLRPMQTLLVTIADLQPAGVPASRATSGPLSPETVHTPGRLRELEMIDQALQSLRRALQQAEADRRLALKQLVTLQEDERAWLARELHDELGQQLTALRLESQVLARQVAALPSASPPLAEQAGRLQAQLAAVQRDLQGMLLRLAPRQGDEAQGGAWLKEMLQALVDGWTRSAGASGGMAVLLDLDLGQDRLPPGLALAVYRISQEALTNAARHARARTVHLRLHRRGDTVDWSVQDDGVGLPDLAAALRRGSGLSGMRQRLWALGADLHVEEARPGLRLRTRLQAGSAPGDTA